MRRGGGVKIGEGESPGYCSPLMSPGYYPESVVHTCIHRHSQSHAQTHGTLYRRRQCQFVRRLTQRSTCEMTANCKVMKRGQRCTSSVPQCTQSHGSDPVSVSLQPQKSLLFLFTGRNNNKMQREMLSQTQQQPCSWIEWSAFV